MLPRMFRRGCCRWYVLPLEAKRMVFLLKLVEQ
jgi:hypothetical protein